ncbi:MAG: RHS repeat domain-containing protein, partial [Spirochaetota bacterium]
MGNTNAMPQSRWVMASVTRSDGMEELLENDLGTTDPEIVGRHSVTEAHSYANGYYDRGERSFYGFNTVRTTYADGSSVQRGYDNTSVYNAGTMHTQVTRDEQGREVQSLARTYTLANAGPAWESGDARWYRLDEERTTARDPATGLAVTTESRYEEYDRYGNPTRFTDGGDTRTVEDDLTAYIDYRYDESSYIVALPTMIRVEDYEHNVVRMREGDYDDAGNLIRHEAYLVGGENPVTTLEWDRYGNLRRVMDPVSYWIRYAYDDVLHTHIIGTEDAYGYAGGAEYDYRFGTPVIETDINGNTMSRTYDIFGRLREVRTDHDTGDIPALAMEYHPQAFPAYAVTENKVHFAAESEETLTTVLVADGMRRVVQTKKEADVYDPQSAQWRYGMTVSGRILYDERGRAVCEGQPGFEEAASGQRLLLDYQGPVALANPTTTEYDALNRPTRTILADGEDQHVGYAVDYAESTVRRVRTIVDPNDNERTEYRDARGNIVRIDQQSEDGPVTTRYAYNAIGEMLSVTDHEGNTTEIAYDMLGRRRAMENPDRGLVEYFYDAAGNLTEMLDPMLRGMAHGIRYEYNMHRLERVDYPAKQDVVFEYGPPEAPENAAGRITRVESEAGSTEYSYGILGEVTEERTVRTRLSPGTHEVVEATTGYRYDYLGRMERIIYPDGEELDYTYDRGGKITRVAGEHLGLTIEYVSRIGYDQFGQRTLIAYGNGVESTYEYDEDRRWLSSINTVANDFTELQDISYQFDAVGNILSVVNDTSRRTVEQTYIYDRRYQITSAEGRYEDHSVGGGSVTYAQSYLYDTIGNITHKTSSARIAPIGVRPGALNYEFAYRYEADQPHRATQIGEQIYRYDVNGNVVSREHYAAAGGGNDQPPPPPSTHPELGENEGYAAEQFGRYRDGSLPDDDEDVASSTFTWDETNRMTSSTVAGELTRYLYDHDGMRSAKRSDRGETIYVNRLYQVEPEQSPDRITKHIYVGETRIASKITNENDPGGAAEELRNTYWYHGDHLGSSNFITDYEGDVFEHLEYTPWGETWVEDGSDRLGRIDWMFTAQERDPETGFYSFPARYYDPQISRWMSVDPAGPELMMPMGSNGNLRTGFSMIESVNWYSYVANNPLKFRDPTGLLMEVGDGVTYNPHTEKFHSYGNSSVKATTRIHVQRTEGHTEGHYRSRLEVRAGNSGDVVLYAGDAQSWADLADPEKNNYYT